MKKILILFTVLLMMFSCVFCCEAKEEYITGYIGGEKVILDRLNVGIKQENLSLFGEVNTEFFDTDMISEVEILAEFPDIKYYTVYLNNPGTANLLEMKAYLEAMNVFESVEFSGFAYLDVNLYDITNDEKTTAEDARFILRCSVGLEKYTEEQLFAGDTDADGALTANDARNVLRYSVGLPVDNQKENYALDSLIIKVKSKYVIDDSFEIALLYNEAVKDYDFLIKATDGGWYLVVHLKEPGKENLLHLKEYYEGLTVVEGVDFNIYAQLD